VLLPQGLTSPDHNPIPENDNWWGKGFAEWTNVVKARSRFRGHYQPHLPPHLGFYDLRLPAARAAIESSDFGYFHRRFNGRQVLKRPVNEKWKNGQPDSRSALLGQRELDTAMGWAGIRDSSRAKIRARRRSVAYPPAHSDFRRRSLYSSR
jgi:hypothetical protein